MDQKMKSRILVTTAVWLVFVAAYAVVYVAKALSGERLEGYERDWSFQLLMFAVTRMPWLIVVLAALLFPLYLRRRSGIR